MQTLIFKNIAMAYDPLKRYKVEKENAERQEQLYNEILEAMRSDEGLREDFKGYNEKTVDDFYKEYAREKMRVLEHGPNEIAYQEKCDLKWVTDAFERLKEIQQKKLFDLQCQWRAEQIELPGVLVSYDFRFWEEHIFQCPFLDPVTEDELEIYRQYLESNNFQEKQGWLDTWQDYDEIKEAYNSEDANRNFPEWYDFHNGRTGKSIYLTLPDIRGQKEEYYFGLWNTERINKAKQNTAPAQIVDKRSFLNYYADDFLKWFVETFETEETQKHFKKLLRFYR